MSLITSLRDYVKEQGYDLDEGPYVQVAIPVKQGSERFELLVSPCMLANAEVEEVQGLK